MDRMYIAIALTIALTIMLILKTDSDVLRIRFFMRNVV